MLYLLCAFLFFFLKGSFSKLMGSRELLLAEHLWDKCSRVNIWEAAGWSEAACLPARLWPPGDGPHQNHLRPTPGLLSHNLGPWLGPLPFSKLSR